MTLAQVRIVEPAEQRWSSRRPVEGGSTLRASGDAVDVIVLDLSETGCAIKAPIAFAVGNDISIGLVGFGTFAAKVVRVDGEVIGCEFPKPISPNIVRIAFETSTVVRADEITAWPSVASAPTPEPVVEKWPARYRVLAMTGCAALLWVGIGTAIASII